MPGLRLIALNNNNCYVFNWWVLYSIDEIKDQLQWLHDTLLIAENRGEKVHILAHIASGEGSCFSYWSREYRRVVERFSETISGQFNGHSHFNEFNIFYSLKDISKPVSVAWNGGSITTYTDVNPNYNVYYVDTINYVSMSLIPSVKTLAFMFKKLKSNFRLKIFFQAYQ